MVCLFKVSKRLPVACTDVLLDHQSLPAQTGNDVAGEMRCGQSLNFRGKFRMVMDVLKQDFAFFFI